MEKDYFISGYTGFCPDMAHRIGQTYTDSTREAMRERPHLRQRLGSMKWQAAQKASIPCREGERECREFEYAYEAMPNYVQGYTGHIPKNLWTSCKEDRRYEDVRCPLKAYPLSCSDYGSTCLDKRCNDEYSVCSGKSHGYDNNMYLKTPHGDFHHTYQMGKPSSKACCSSCAKGGPCEGERRSAYQSSKQSSKSCCGSCSRGGPCERDRINHYQAPTKCSKSCCTSYSKGGMRESDRRSHCSSSKPSSYSTCSGRRKDPSPPSYCKFKYRELEVKPYRKCGVIPNYMGYIPGMQMTFGEPYGITANRLLQRHFNEQENRRI
ncbi:uncharacterized protein CDAR_415951 [Caerostris darwini]|uniref:Ciliary microtubule inner protein 2A-C-like domain-containing protein n=1 Tax=Caerostris darwini TaxID=1538125 RepID=A0AAV4UMA4_9ARAC|nr:uncharacterized protein CDAR_415951 [Caerostris darwini]